MKLFSRYNRVILMITVIIFLLSSIVYYYLLNYILIKEVDEVINHRIARMQQYVQKTGHLPIPDHMGEVMVRYTLVQKPISGIRSSFVELYDSSEKKKGPFRKAVFTLPVNMQNIEVTLARPLAGTRDLALTIILVTLSTILLILVTSLLVNRTLLQRLWQPFYDTIAAMRRYKLGKIKDVKLPETSIEEFVFLNENLKDTINKAEQEYLALKEFTENASHELQTPLAIIRSKLDVYIQREDLSEVQSEELKEIYVAVKRLSRLSGSLLLLTKISNQQFENTSLIPLANKLGEKVHQFHELWNTNRLKVHTQLDEAFIHANPDLLDILLNNLVSNATRHNYEGGEIDIDLKAHRLVISNTGSLKPLDQKRIFRRFYKEEAHSQHNGLGLSIIKQICDQSNIRITYDYKNDKHYFQLEWQ